MSNPTIPSLTTWNRLEPRPRTVTSDARRSLAAEVRDPLWMLTRQWQFGEFAGEDGGSIAWTSVTTDVVRDRFWGPSGTTLLPQNRLLGEDGLPELPIEAALEREALSEAADLTLAVELGQVLEDLLAGATPGGGIPSLQDLRSHYPLATASVASAEDADLFAEFCAGRVCNGTTAYADIRQGQLGGVHIPASGGLRDLSDRFLAAAARVTGDDRFATDGTWRADLMRYRGGVAAGDSPATPRINLAVTPGLAGEIDWYSFDTLAEPLDRAGAPTRYMIPGHVRFRGMPNARFWDFESSESDMGAITPDVRELGKLLFMDFMLIQGNDWFMLPMPMEVGAICLIPQMSVRSVFGEDIPVRRAETNHPGWSMFSTTRRTVTPRHESARPACGPVITEGVDYFLHLPASASMARQEASAIETVRLQRDDVADMAWAIERTVPDRLGQARPARERENGRPSPTPPVRREGTPSVQYVLQSAPPAWWFPLVPVSAGEEGQIVFSPGVLAGTEENAVAQGRILTEIQGLTGRRNPIQIREEEIPRTGIELHRSFQMTRWLDGRVIVWCQRARRAGESEGSSGLRFDRIEANR